MPQAHPWPGLVLPPSPHWAEALPTAGAGLPPACCATDAGGNGSASCILVRCSHCTKALRIKRQAETWEDGTTTRGSRRVGAWRRDASPAQPGTCRGLGQMPALLTAPHCQPGLTLPVPSLNVPAHQPHEGKAGEWGGNAVRQPPPPRKR